jgi:GntR family transcriptional regulator
VQYFGWAEEPPAGASPPGFIFGRGHSRTINQFHHQDEFKMPSRKSDFVELNITPVDPNNPLPLYIQVLADLKGTISSGKLRPKDMLPPEVALSKAYGVSRQTMRQAILRLVDENLLERKAGRGTMVVAQENRPKFYLDRSFAQQMIEMGMTPHSEVLKISEGIIDDTSPEPLHVRLGAKCLVLVRLRFGDQTPIGIQYTTIITDLCPDLANHDFNSGSLYNILWTEYKLPIVRIDQIISAVNADEWHCSLLKTVPGAALLHVRTAAYLENGEPMESSTSYYRADKYWFSTSHTYFEGGKTKTDASQNSLKGPLEERRYR